MPSTLTFPHRKEIRARIIKAWLSFTGKEAVVACSCGNATRAMHDLGLEVLDLSPRGAMAPNRWLDAGWMAKNFPRHLDATPGHMPLVFLHDLAVTYQRLPDLLNQVKPGDEYDDHAPATKRDSKNPLNAIVEATGPIVHRSE